MRRSAILTTLVSLLLMASLARGTESYFKTEQERFLEGYVAALFEREFGWTEEDYRLEIHNSDVTVALTEKAPVIRAQAITLLGEIDRIDNLKVYVTTKAALAGETTLPRAKTNRERLLLSLGVPPDQLALPRDRLFAPLIADPKQLQFFISTQWLRTENCEDVESSQCFDEPMGIVAYGEQFGIYRRPGKRRTDGLQISLAAGMFAQFQLQTSSKDLVVADYHIGIPVTYRKGAYSAKYNIYHQSSHLGDENLIRNKPDRVNFDYESFETIHSFTRQRFRTYLGMEWLFRRSPSSFDSLAFHTGMELRPLDTGFTQTSFIGAIDVKAWEEHDYEPGVNIEAGFDYGSEERFSRHLKTTLQYYYGHSPYGQLYDLKISYFGLKISFGF